MDESLLNACYEFSDYCRMIKEGAGWSAYSQTIPLCAYICQAYRREPNLEMIRLCRTIIKQYNGIFSEFRGTMEPVFITYMSVDNDPEAKLLAAQRAYDCLKEYFPGRDTVAVLAMFMTDLVHYEDYPAASAAVKMTYDAMKEDHYFLTGSEDILLAGLIAFTFGFSRRVIDEAEMAFVYMKKRHAFHSNAMQSAAQVMTMCGGAWYEKCARTEELYNCLKDAGMKYGQDFEMVSLAVLANLGIDPAQVTNDMYEVDRYLETQKEYGIFGYSKRNRLVHAVMILAVYYLNQNPALTCSVALSVILEIRAQQAAAAAAAA